MKSAFESAREHMRNQEKTKAARSKSPFKPPAMTQECCKMTKRIFTAPICNIVEPVEPQDLPLSIGHET